MRILYLANNWVGVEVLRWLQGQGEEIVGIVLNPPDKQKYAEEILAQAGLPEDCVFDGSQMGEPTTQDAIRSLRPEIGLLVFFGCIIRRSFIDMFEKGILNLHPSYLPYNRGASPNVWSIIEGTPAGATIHYIDESIDTGDIVGQQEVDVDPIDTGESLYRKLELACVDLFRATWPAVRQGRVEGIPQVKDRGTYHRIRDIDRIDRIDPQRMYSAKELLDILRACTFPPYKGAYLDLDGGRIYIRVQLEYGD